ncbi:hypothetical protein V8C44DRAFT_130652 [Trichoderma aethiopicum]
MACVYLCVVAVVFMVRLYVKVSTLLRRRAGAYMGRYHPTAEGDGFLFMQTRLLDVNARINSMIISCYHHARKGSPGPAFRALFRRLGPARLAVLSVVS